jgi:hypothetical protein
MRGNKHSFLSTEISPVTFCYGVLSNLDTRGWRFEWVQFNICWVLNFPFLFRFKNVSKPSLSQAAFSRVVNFTDISITVQWTRSKMSNFCRISGKYSQSGKLSIVCLIIVVAFPRFMYLATRRNEWVWLSIYFLGEYKRVGKRRLSICCKNTYV